MSEIRTLPVGSAAPDFELPTVDGESISLSKFKGRKNVVIEIAHYR